MYINYYTKDQLLSSIKEVTKYVELRNNDESSVIVSEYGGRPLGIFPKNESFSLLWITSDIKKKIISREREIGGDRHWLSPERAYFFQKPEKWKKWNCQSGLDPAYYKIKEQNSNNCKLESEIVIENYISRETYKGKIIRTISLVDNPISSEADYIGIEINEECILNKPDLKINIWNIANVISGGKDNPGTVIIPTIKKANPISYIKNIPEEMLKIEKNYTAFKIDVSKIYKLGIRPEDLNFSNKAKITYYLKIPNTEDYGLLVKLSDDLPRSQKDCYDLPRNPERKHLEKGIIQAYNSKSSNEKKLSYGEIELHFNPPKTEKNKSILRAKHKLLAYIGKKDDILSVLEKLLGFNNLEFF
ncbi:MAG: hypothetical protein JXA99_00290 [Candidatus Lokiarchaeota archaeon]|nr:hypothetical protein [Candidatus Lokiarchaeota archaeon]